jgi:hypothetical protein
MADDDDGNDEKQPSEKPKSNDTPDKSRPDSEKQKENADRDRALDRLMADLEKRLRDFENSDPSKSTGSRDTEAPHLIDPKELDLSRDFDPIKAAREAGIDTSPLEQYRDTIIAASYFGVNFPTVGPNGTYTEHAPLTQDDFKNPYDLGPKPDGISPTMWSIMTGLALSTETPESASPDIAPDYLTPKDNPYAKLVEVIMKFFELKNDSGKHFEFSRWEQLQRPTNRFK